MIQYASPGIYLVQIFCTDLNFLLLLNIESKIELRYDNWASFSFNSTASLNKFCDNPGSKMAV